MVSRRTWTGWTKKSKADWDMAVGRLDRNTGTGYLPFRNAVGSSLEEDDRVYVKGYPQGEPHEKPSRTMWRTTGTVWDETSHQIRSRSYDASGGLSGAPLYKVENGKAIVYGVHRGSKCCYWFKKYNRATKLNTARMDSICDFIGGNTVSSC